MLDQSTHLACSLPGTQGRKLRGDGTVGATTIPHPPDSPLLHDGVRGLSRALGHAKTLLQDGAAVAQDASTAYAQQARDKMTRMMEVARQ